MYRVEQIRRAGACLAGLLIAGSTACGPASAPPTTPNASSASSTASRPDASAAVSLDELLPPVAAYVTAVNAKNLDGLVRAFAPNGEVVDVGRRFAGHDAIRRWAETEVIGGTLTVRAVLENEPNRQRLLVTFAPSGTGGFGANYTFTVDGPTITSAVLTYA
jgi:hypothetical protein